MIEIDLDSKIKLTQEEQDEADKCIDYLNKKGIFEFIRQNKTLAIEEPSLFITTLLLTLNQEKIIIINHK